MSESHNPYFSRQNERDPTAFILRRLLAETPHVTGELIGVFAYNVRHTNLGEDFLNVPIPIGNIDQLSLEHMRLIRSPKPYEHEQAESPTVALTHLGIAVVKRAVFVAGSTEPGELPRIDTEDLLAALAKKPLD